MPSMHALSHAPQLPRGIHPNYEQSSKQAACSHAHTHPTTTNAQPPPVRQPHTPRSGYRSSFCYLNDNPQGERGELALHRPPHSPHQPLPGIHAGDVAVPAPHRRRERRHVALARAAHALPRGQRAAPGQAQDAGGRVRGHHHLPGPRRGGHPGVQVPGVALQEVHPGAAEGPLRCRWGV
jgi:hypothetical protein